MIFNTGEVDKKELELDGNFWKLGVLNLTPNEDEPSLPLPAHHYDDQDAFEIKKDLSKEAVNHI